MKFLANIVSNIFHPLFVVSYALLILILVNPYLFSVQEPKQKFIIVLSIVLLSAFFPLLAIVMMRGLGFLNSLKTMKRRERIGPLIVTAIFYLWLYINIRNNPLIPSAFTSFVLGATIALFLAFFINNFSKISLHAVGMGGILAIVILVRLFFSYESFSLDLGSLGIYYIHFNLLILVTLILAGMVGTARLILSAHVPGDIWGGYLVGLVGQLISFRILYIS